MNAPAAVASVPPRQVPRDQVLSSARRKKNDGLPLTLVEEKAYQKWTRGFNKLAYKVYFESPEQIEKLREQARKDGETNLSHWLLEKIKLGADGKVVDRAYLQAIQKEAETRRRDLEVERDHSNEYRVENRELRKKVSALEQKVQHFTDIYQRLVVQGILKE